MKKAQSTVILLTIIYSVFLDILRLKAKIENIIYIKGSDGHDEFP